MTANSGTPAAATERRSIAEFHAHIYYDPARPRAAAERLRERVAAEFPLARLGRWHDALVGPHTQSMYQIAFPGEMLAAFVPWLMLNRDGLTILLHPETGQRLSGSYRARRLVRRRAAVAPRGLCRARRGGLSVRAVDARWNHAEPRPLLAG